MTRIIHYAIFGSLSVIADVLINLTANSVRLPKGLYLAPAGALACVILITAVIDARHGGPAGGKILTHQGKQVADIEQDGIIIRGRRVRKKHYALGAFTAFVLAYMALLIAGVYLRGHDDFFLGHTHANRLESSISGSVCVVLVAIGLYLAIGFRSWVGVSESGVFVRDERGKYHIPWSEVIQFSTRSSWGSTYLLAELPPKSRLLFSGPWVLDRKQANVIRIFDLTKYGIAKHAVKGALAYWEPST